MIIALGLEDQPNPSYILTREELSTLYEFLSHQYISYENLALLQLVKEMRGICACSETEAK